MAIILKSEKGLPLSHAEMDGNFIDIDSRLVDLETTTPASYQSLTLNGSALSISGGNTVNLPPSVTTQISVSQNTASGNGSLTYDNATGVFTYTPPDIDSGGSSFDQDLNTTDNVTFNTLTTPNLVLGGDVTTQNELFIDGGAQAIGIKSQVNIVIDGDVTFQNGTVSGLTANTFGLTYNDNGLATEIGVTADIFDFGDGKTIDMQNSSVLLNGSTVSAFTQSETSSNIYGTNTHTTTIEQDGGYTKFSKTDVINDEFGEETYTTTLQFDRSGIDFEGSAFGASFALRNTTKGGDLNITCAGGNAVDGERDAGDIDIRPGVPASGGVGGNVVINSNSGDIFIGPLSGNTNSIKIGGGPKNNAATYGGGVPTTFYGAIDFNGQTVTGLTGFSTLSDDITIDAGAASTVTLSATGSGISIASAGGVNINNNGIGTINIGHSTNQTNFAGTVDFNSATVNGLPSYNNGGIVYQLGYSAHDAVSVADGDFSVNSVDMIVSLTAGSHAQGVRIDVSGVTSSTSTGAGPIYIQRRVNGGSWLTWNAFIVKGTEDHFSHSFVDFYDTGGTGNDIAAGDTVEYKLTNGTSNPNFNGTESGVDFELFWGFNFTATEVPLSYSLTQP
jgi:hypothetical protein